MKWCPLSLCLLAIAGCSPTSAPPEASAGSFNAEPQQLPAAAQEEEGDRPATREELLQLCGGYGELASGVMEARQAGVPMKKLLESMNKDGEHPATTKIIMAAYDAPRFSTEEHQRREVVEFENSIYSACLKELDAT